MSFERHGRAPCPAGRGIVSAGLVGLMVLLTGCANERSAATSSDPRVASALHMAGVRAEIEADGLPAQLAPRERPQEPDDPTEPWSPNYGTVRPVRTGTTTPSAQVTPLQPPVTLVHYRSPVDAEDVIRRAVAEHEMRQDH